MAAIISSASREVHERELTQSLINVAQYGDAIQKPGKRSVLADGGFWTAVLTIANAALGAGLLSLPYAIASAGMLVGPISCLVLIVGCFVSLCVILGLMDRASSSGQAINTFGELVRWGCGPAASWGVELLVILNSFGADIGYLVLLGDVFTPLLEGALKDAFGWTRDQARPLVVAGASLLCLLLSLLRRINMLRYSAGVAVFACFFTTGLLAAQAAEHPCRLGDCLDEATPPRNGWCDAAQVANSSYTACNPESRAAGVSLWPLAGVGLGALLRAFPLLVNAMQCHIQAAFVFAELPSRLRGPASRRAIAFSVFGLLAFLYLFVGSAGVLRFGAQTQGDCLTNFSDTDGMASIARVAVGLTALSAYPMQHFPARAVIYRVWREVLGCSQAQPRMSNLFLFIEGPLWVGVTVVLALAIGSDLSFVFELLGAVVRAAHPTFAPPLSLSLSLSLPSSVAWAPLALTPFPPRRPQVVGSVIFLVPCALLYHQGGSRIQLLAFLAVGCFITISGTYISIHEKLAEKQ
jgi:amino acid permease